MTPADVFDPEQFVGYGCCLLTEAAVKVERIETRGVWFVCTGAYPTERGVYAIVHAPTGASIAAYPGHERGMRRAIDLVRLLPETFGAAAPWGEKGMIALNKSPDMATLERIVKRARGHLWLKRYGERLDAMLDTSVSKRVQQRRGRA